LEAERFEKYKTGWGKGNTKLSFAKNERMMKYKKESEGKERSAKYSKRMGGKLCSNYTTHQKKKKRVQA
jgi:hypothetical protein